MRHLRGDVSVVGSRGDGVEVVGVVPVPRQLFGSAPLGVLDAFHQVDQQTCWSVRQGACSRVCTPLPQRHSEAAELPSSKDFTLRRADAH